MSPSAYPRGAHLGLKWEVITNHFDGDTFHATLTITNHGDVRLPGSGWSIYFNSARKPLPENVTGGAVISHVNGDLFKLAPGAHFGNLAPGVSREIGYVANFWAILETDAPIGFFIVYDEGTPEARAEAIGDPEVAPFTHPSQLTRTPADQVPLQTSALTFRRNAVLSLLPQESVGKITPAPLTSSFGEGAFVIEPSTAIVHASSLASEAKFLVSVLSELMTASPRLTAKDQPKAIRLRLDAELDVADSGVADQAYRLAISEGGVDISARSPEGIFYGIQSLLHLVPIEAWHQAEPRLSVPHCEVNDAPRFAYRGLHLDVARNFSSKRTVLEILDLMALYKLNRLHFHVTDDEGWRIPIASLPELTDVGAKRGFGPDESACLVPSFGSGLDPSSEPGSGHYTPEDFVEILRHARHRHIEVIPEIDLPGHARAAIVAMRARSARLRREGKLEEAETHSLVDPDDASQYESVQMWKDNVVCIARESCYTFVETVVRDIKSLYEEAGVALRTLHVGGDEVPHGAWEKSPICQAFMRDRGMTSVRELEEYFFTRLSDILNRHEIGIAGWEEVALVDVKEDGIAVARPNTELLGRGLRTHVWNNVWGWGREDIAYRLANAGFEVVLCNVTNLYLDLAHEKHPAEPGYYWGGFLDTRKVFEFCPNDIYTLATVDLLGHPLDGAKLAKMERLTPQGEKRIVGMQGHLWGENLRSRERTQYLLMPRLLAVAERAWTQDPRWTSMTDSDERARLMDGDWNEFANRLGQRELPRLDALGIAYRLPVPGVSVEGGVLSANISTPGIPLRYSFDGTHPTLESPVYQAPVPLLPDSKPRVAAFSTTGRRSRVASPGV